MPAVDRPWRNAQVRMRIAWSSFVRDFGPINHTTVSIQDYDLETDMAKPGLIFAIRMIPPPMPPVITNAADALAVVLNECGHVDLDHIAELLHLDVSTVIADLGDEVFRDPADGSWQTADAYLSDAVRTKLAAAQAAAELDPSYERNVRVLTEVQPAHPRPPT